MRPLLIAGVVFITWVPSAYALCFEPRAPSAPFGSAPSAPYCDLDGTGYDRCDQYDVDSFRDEVNSYVRNMERYSDEVRAYKTDALDFAKCEEKEAVEVWNDFVAGY